MNEITVMLSGKNITLNASALTLIQYKRLSERDFYADRNKHLSELQKAIDFNIKYGALTDSDFEKMPREKQDNFWRELKGINIDTEFILNIICAMAYAGEYKGSREELLKAISPADMAPDSNLMQATNKLMEALTPDIKKKLEIARRKNIIPSTIPRRK